MLCRILRIFNLRNDFIFFRCFHIFLTKIRDSLEKTTISRHFGKFPAGLNCPGLAVGLRPHLFFLRKKNGSTTRHTRHTRPNRLDSTAQADQSTGCCYCFIPGTRIRIGCHGRSHGQQSVVARESSSILM